MKRAAVIASVFGLLLEPSLGSARVAPDKEERCSYEVVSGDHLGRIANKVGLTQKELLGENPKLARDPDKLRVGQTLDVCVAATKSSSKSSSKTKKAAAEKPVGKRCGHGGRIVDHEIAKGDNLSKIASRYAVTEKAIIGRNAKLRRNPNLLVVGQTVAVCADEQAAKSPKSKTCGYRTPLLKHQVVPGEHLGQIAGRYGVRRGDLVKWNAKLRSNADLLSVGQTIRVCPEIVPRQRTKIEYSVASGDSFGEIAKRYDLTRSELESYQRGRLKDTSKLRVGDTLVVWVDGPIVPGFGGIDDDKGVLKGGVQLPPGKHYHIKWKAAAWGTTKAVSAIQTAVNDYQRRKPGGPKIHIGDLSKRAGGPFKPHVSHQHGNDVDIGYVLKGKLADETRFKTANKKNLDVARTWRLLKSLIDTGDVQYIFMSHKLQKLVYEYAKSKGVSSETLDELFQYPRGRGRTHGMIRHWPGHVNHFHVRFRR